MASKVFFDCVKIQKGATAVTDPVLRASLIHADGSFAGLLDRESALEKLDEGQKSILNEVWGRAVKIVKDAGFRHNNIPDSVHPDFAAE